MRAAKVQASLRIRAVSPEPSLLAHISSVSRGTFRQKARSLAPLNGWACAVKICHDGMHEDTNLLDRAQMMCYGSGKNGKVQFGKQGFQDAPQLGNVLLHITGIKHDFLCTNVCWAPMQVLKPRAWKAERQTPKSFLMTWLINIG